VTREQETALLRLGLAVQGSGGQYESEEHGRGDRVVVVLTCRWPGVEHRTVILANGERL
jgi:hypothetical protein